VENSVFGFWVSFTTIGAGKVMKN